MDKRRFGMARLVPLSALDATPVVSQPSARSASGRRILVSELPLKRDAMRQGEPYLKVHWEAS
jgi:hypothetical protein